MAARTKDKATTKYDFTAADIERERMKGLSWAKVAEALGCLKNGKPQPGAVRAAYTELTGKSHNDIAGAPVKAPRNSAPKAPDQKAHRQRVAAAPVEVEVDRNPHWHVDSDQDEIIARLTPGTRLLVQRANGFVEEIVVDILHGLCWSKDETELCVEFAEAHSGNYRCVRVNDLQEVW
jgi:hypothetical protein